MRKRVNTLDLVVSHNLHRSTKDPIVSAHRMLQQQAQRDARRIVSKTTRDLTARIVTLYTVHHLTMDEIGRLIGMTRSSVWKRLKKAGVTRDQGERIITACAYCGIAVNRPRSRKTENGLSWYCSAEHYYATRENPDYQEWRQGGRLARAVVSQHYPIQRGQVVHHKDGNQRNNDRANLAVYASQADHLAMHHGRTIEPLWDGAHH